MFEKELIRDNSFKTVFKKEKNYGFSFESRIPFYRALPLSCIENVNLIVNDEPIENKNITLVLRGTEYHLDEISPLMNIWWGFVENVTFLVKNPGTPYRGKIELDLTMRIRLPYLIPANGEDRPNYDNTRVVKSFNI